MGAQGTSIEVRGDGDREALHEAIWAHVRGYLKQFHVTGPYWDLTWYLPEAERYDSWGVQGDELTWMFPDCAGGCTRSKYMWSHWMAIALAAQWDEIAALAAEHDLEITDERRTLHVGGDGGLVEIRGNVWKIMDEALMGDSKHIAIEDLDADELARVEAARLSCACAPCRMLQPPPPEPPRAPEPEREPVMEPEPANVDELLALIARTDASRARIESSASALDGAWDGVMAALPTFEGRARANAMFALVAAKRTPEHTAWLLDRIRTALANERDEAACALAVLAGRFRGRPEVPMMIARVLERTSIPEALRAAAVEGLDQIRGSSPMPPEIRELLEREYALGGRASYLADALLRSW